MPAACKAGASLSYPVAPSWASGRIGGGHILSLLPVVSAGLYSMGKGLHAFTMRAPRLPIYFENRGKPT